jgi:glycosyltransferase involved in cell wall biosynthesis
MIAVTEQPLRIAVLMSGTGVNGAAMHCLDLIGYLVARGHDVLLVHRPDAWIAGRPQLAGAARFASSFSRAPRELIRVTRRLNAFRPDVLHTHMSSAHSYGMLARLLSRRPVVATAHSTSLQLHWRFNNVVIATSPAAAEHHRRVNRVPAAALRTIPNFVSTASFPAVTAEQRQAARRALGVPAETLLIGSVGDIGPRKRQIDLVHALAIILKSVPEARLLLAGAPHAAYFAELTQTAENLGVRSHLILPGPTDISKMLAAFDLFVLSSGKETGPIAVLEAMARGLPIVSTDVGMVRQFLQDGATGHIVAIGDTSAMAQRVLDLSHDAARRDAMGQAAAASVRANYDIAILAPKIEHELREAARIRNRPAFGFVAGLFGL